MTLNTHTGNLVWQQNNPPADTATCSEEVVFSSGVPRDSILAYDITTGEKLWSGTEPRKSFHGLVYHPASQEIIAGAGDMLYTVEPRSGRLQRSFKKVATPPSDGSPYRGPMYLIDQGELFIGGTVLDADTGEVIHKEEDYTTLFPPMVTTDTMYLSAFDKGVVAFDRTNYDIKWIYQPAPSDSLNPLAPIAILNGVGYVIFSDATLRAFDLQTGEELGYWQPDTGDLWFWPICPFPPLLCVRSARAGLATSDDTLFVSFGNGKLYAFGQ
jgi:outer membrane protein assembly factor BamB